MKKKPNTSPPVWLDRILEFYCKSDLLEDLQGDLHEYYYRNLKKGKVRANLIYLLDIIKFFRLYTLRKPQNSVSMNFLHLLSNNLKTSIRSLGRNRLFSSINIIGLSISMSIGILILTYITNLLSYDTFHDKSDQIYRITSSYHNAVSQDKFNVASTSVFIGEKIRESYSGLEHIVTLRNGFQDDIAIKNHALSVGGIYASEEFFDTFSFEMVSGDKSTALQQPNSMVLTQSIATKLFKKTNPIGAIIEGKDKSYTITGVMADIPQNSHLQFEALVSLKTIEHTLQGREKADFYSWSSIWSNYVYITLPEGHDTNALQQKIRQITDAENAQQENHTINLHLESLLDIVPGKELSNQIGPSTAWTAIYQIVLLTLIVVVSACFNYTNLSVARSLRRAKEVGVRKIVGASRWLIFLQFIMEAVIISLFSLAIAYLLALVWKPYFEAIFMDDYPMDMTFTLTHGIYFIGFAIAIGLLAGIAPAMAVSRFQVLSSLMNTGQLKLLKGLNLRRALIILQFALSMMFIIGATISYRQYQYSLNFDLGFNTKNILNIPLKGNDSGLLKNELEQLSEITQISKSKIIPSTGNRSIHGAKFQDPQDSVMVNINYADKNYLPAHEYEFIAGGSFPFDTDQENPKFVVINDFLRKRFFIESPEKAIGQTLTILRRSEAMKLQITGVVTDFQHDRINSKVGPCAIIQGQTRDFEYLNLQVNTSNITKTMDKIEAVWSQFDTIHPFEAQFYDDELQEAYAEHERLFKIFGFLGFLAISIAAMGLLGMAVFTTETRLKEISIRKILGASESNLLLTLSKGFLWMLFIASAIAIPCSYLFFDSMVLEDYANRVTIGAVELLSGAVLVFVLGWLTISWQALLAIRMNPADTLRNE